ncbi:hypothetical protein SPONL_1767 [uncultured Candidatus Thioglobus sp.]|nr:hypothetical protein SPONL_1767 [uncultured Candidatus Thioglobus sp.]
MGRLELDNNTKISVETLSFDNGREFSQHYKLAQLLDCSTYFAKLYHTGSVV